MENKVLIEEEHHKQIKLCETRPAYRQGRNLTAVKIYTINNESQHLFIYGVPKINLRNELKNLCLKYGEVSNLHVVTEYKTEIFSECYHLHYKRIQSARVAKKLIDNKCFYGGVLHVCYAPEYETLLETKEKLLQRTKSVMTRIADGYETNTFKHIIPMKLIKVNRKRKHPAIEINEERMAHLNAADVWKSVPVDLDPMLQNLKTKRMDKPVKHYQIPGVEYGPYLSDLSTVQCEKHEYRKEETIPGKFKPLIPMPILKQSIKRIIFRKTVN